MMYNLNKFKLYEACTNCSPCGEPQLMYKMTIPFHGRFMPKVYQKGIDIIMSKKKGKKKRNTGQAQSAKQRYGGVRLSQCMIVKNEEKHIERALAWARDFAFEQIVVDTGSTDRTVELAEKLGAKVYHFEWINDFSAAKNFAMDQAKGSWIAILDADEYMPREDIEELMTILKKIQSDPITAKQYDAITNSWVQLDDNDSVIAVLTNQRIFRNSPELRYTGKIHESVTVRNMQVNAANLRIMHTGYAQSTYNEADKRQRNIKMLRDEVAREPDNPDMMIYLADSIKAGGTDEDHKEAEELYLKALSSKKPATTDIKRLAYDYLIRRFSDNNEKSAEAVKLCDKAISELPDNIDYRYYRALQNNKKGNYSAALDDLEKCEKAFISSEKIPETRILLPCPIPLFIQMRIAAHGLGDEEGVTRNSTIISAMLTDGKANPDAIGAFIKVLLVYGVPDEEILAELGEIYDFDNPGDLLFIARVAKDCGAIGFARKVMEMAQAAMEK